MALQAAALDLTQAEGRARGVAALPRVLWRDCAPVQAFPRLGMDRGAYLRELLPHLTAAEQVGRLAKSGNQPGGAAARPAGCGAPCSPAATPSHRGASMQAGRARREAGVRVQHSLIASCT